MGQNPRGMNIAHPPSVASNHGTGSSSRHRPTCMIARALMQEPRLPSGLSSRLLGRWERETSSNVGGDSGVDVFDSLRVRSLRRSSFAPGSSGSSTVADRSVFRSGLPEPLRQELMLLDPCGVEPLPARYAVVPGRGISVVSGSGRHYGQRRSRAGSESI